MTDFSAGLEKKIALVYIMKGTFEKLAFSNFFECADEFCCRYNGATKNIAFSKLPIKTEVFIGFLKTVH